MDPVALQKLNYGVFVLGVNDGERVNACITNTCMQVANDPTRVAISVINKNYSCEILKASDSFAMTILDATATYETIKHFGMQSGRDVDKLSDFPHATNDEGLPYLEKESCAVLFCKVISSEDLGSHTLFVAEVVDAAVLSDAAPLSYSEYHTRLKPKPASAPQRKIIGWRCMICGYEYEGEELPEDFLCPWCGHDASDFEPIYAD